MHYNNQGQPIVNMGPALQPGNPYGPMPGNPYGTDSLAYGVKSASQPANTTTHAISFDFYSQNYFSQNPSGHIFVLIKGRWAYDNPATLPNEGELSGRGIAIGNVSGAVGGCQNPSYAQVESFWSSFHGIYGNQLFPTTCSNQLFDNHWYKIVVHANNNRWVAYYITDSSGTIFYANYAIQDPNSFIPENLGGWAISPVLSQVHADTWRLYFRNVETWWF